MQRSPCVDGARGAPYVDVVLRLILNLLWVIFGGFIIWLEYMVVGVVLCLTIVGIPFGKQCFKLAWLGLLPFGKDIHHDRKGMPLLGTLGNMVWFFFAGIWICLSHLSLALAQAVTIIGIPFALQHLKLAVLALWPFGARAA